MIQEDYKSCLEILASIEVWRPHFDGWIVHGCYQRQIYGADVTSGGDMTLITPCPSHVICGVLTPAGTRHPGAKAKKDKETLPYCPRALDEYDQKSLSEKSPPGPMPKKEDLIPIKLLPAHL